MSDVVKVIGCNNRVQLLDGPYAGEIADVSRGPIPPHDTEAEAFTSYERIQGKIIVWGCDWDEKPNPPISSANPTVGDYMYGRVR